MKAWAWALGAAILVVVGLGSGAYAIYSPPPCIPDKFVPIASDVSGIWTGRSYAYVIRRDNCVVLVDAGSDPGGTALMGHFGLQQLTPDNVAAVLLTHGHIDSRAALHLMNRATVYVGREDAPLARGDTLPHAPYSRLLQRLSPAVPMPMQSFEMPLPGAEITACGVTFQVIALPGHTPGSLAYRMGDVLFTGDAMALENDAITAPKWGWSENTGHAKRILRRLAQVPFKSVATSHDGYLPDGQKQLETWLGGAQAS